MSRGLIIFRLAFFTISGAAVGFLVGQTLISTFIGVVVGLMVACVNLTK